MQLINLFNKIIDQQLISNQLVINIPSPELRQLYS